MAKRHDENKDVRSIARLVKVEQWNKTIHVSKQSNLGIHTWGKIDYLCGYCGYILLWDGGKAGLNNEPADKPKDKSYRDVKKAAKEHKLTDKTKSKRSKK